MSGKMYLMFLSFGLFCIYQGQCFDIDSRELQAEDSGADNHDETEEHDDHNHGMMHMPKMYIGGTVIAQTTNNMCDETSDITQYSSASGTACGTKTAPCYAKAYGAMKDYDCVEGCMYKANITFTDIYDLEGKSFMLEDIYIKIFENVDDEETMMSGEADDKKPVTLMLEQRLYMKCEVFCEVVAGTNKKIYCLSAGEASKCQLSDLPDLPTGATTATPTAVSTITIGRCVIADNVPNSDCPKLLQHTYGERIMATLKKTEECKNSVEFVEFKEGDASKRCPDQTIVNNMACGHKEKEHKSKCYSNTQIGVVPWVCEKMMDKSHPSAGIATLDVGNAPNQIVKMKTHVKFFDHLEAHILHPTMKISQNALNGLVEGKAICKSDDSSTSVTVEPTRLLQTSSEAADTTEMKYYVIEMDQDCSEGYSKIAENVGTELRNIVSTKKMVLNEIVGSGVMLREPVVFFFALTVSIFWWLM